MGMLTRAAIRKVKRGAKNKKKRGSRLLGSKRW